MLEDVQFASLDLLLAAAGHTWGVIALLEHETFETFLVSEYVTSFNPLATVTCAFHIPLIRTHTCC